MIKYFCNPKCRYFPLDSYISNTKDTYKDEYGITHSVISPKCYNTGAAIKNWDFCKHYKRMFLNDTKVLVFIGKSASGKDTAIQYLLSHYKNCAPIISTTDRPKRKNEQDDREYHFVNSEQFMQKIANNEFIEYREYTTLVNDTPATWHYGITKAELEQDKLLLTNIDFDGYEKLKQHIGIKNLTAIYIDTYPQLRKSRAVLRGSFDETEWNRRAKDDDIKFTRQKTITNCQYYITNNEDIQEFYKDLDRLMQDYGQQTKK